MPCYQTGTLAGDLALDAEEARKQVTRLARMLCTTCEAMERLNAIDRLPGSIQRWWKQHKKIDQHPNRVRVQCGECHKTYTTTRGSHRHRHPSHHDHCSGAGR